MKILVVLATALALVSGQGANNGNANNGNASNSSGSNVAVRNGGIPEGYGPCNFGIGQCVPYYLCSEGNIITDGAGLIDIRFGPSSSATDDSAGSSHSECPNFLDVCCIAPETVPVVTPTPITDARCGIRYEEGINSRITGFKDNQAQFGEFPWMAAVLRKEYIEDKELNLYVCGGSIIHPLVILTAAHCVYSKSPDSLKVRLGEWDTQRTYELYPHEDFNVLHVETHPKYNPGALWNDFALLFLEREVNLDNPHIGTVCLPQLYPQYDEYDCWATGWGRDEFGKEGSYQNVLKEIRLPTVDKNTCQNALRTTRLGLHFRLDPSFICAGGEVGLDTCKGDGGSPLVCRVKGGDQYIQAGIVAWGIGCGENGIPGVYADVSVGEGWITSTADAILLQRYTLDTTNYWKP